MSQDHQGITAYTAVLLIGSAAIAALMVQAGVSAEDAGATPFILAIMWLPTLARWIAIRWFDRGWRSPFPLKRWSSPPIVSVVVPFLIVCAIYSSAYTLAMVLGIPQGSPSWQGVRAIANVGISLVAMSTLGLLGALGEELGWRGYLQPRLDELRVRNSLLWVIAIETLYHLPLVLFGGYLGGVNRLAMVALFISLSFGVVPLWTWATYRWCTIWIAVWFHTFHNGISQIALPNLLGAGSPLLLGESGVLPVFMYLVTAAIVFGRMRSRGQHWPDVVDEVLTGRVARIQS